MDYLRRKENVTKKILSANGLYKIVKSSFEIGKGPCYREKGKGISTLC